MSLDPHTRTRRRAGGIGALEETVAKKDALARTLAGEKISRVSSSQLFIFVVAARTSTV
jgi:hypothetical protein